jgi:transcriptional regulator with XRE-family HTH domain
MKNLGEQILSLREKGYSYRQIEKELGCARSTISY